VKNSSSSDPFKKEKRRRGTPIEQPGSSLKTPESMYASYLPTPRVNCEAADRLSMHFSSARFMSMSYQSSLAPILFGELNYSIKPISKFSTNYSVPILSLL
jgi:hypothetical protein